MANKDSIKKLSNNVKIFCEDREWDKFHSPKELAIGLSTESAELLELFRFKTDAQERTMIRDIVVREKIADELADCLIFLLRFGQMYDFDLYECVERKLEKNTRKYPIDKSKGKNLKYDEL